MKLRFLFSLMLGASLAASAQGYQDGVDNYNAGRLDVAKVILNNTLNNANTDKAVSYYYLGNIDFVEGNVAGAKANYEKGLQVNPNDPYNMIGMGEVALKQGNKAEANRLFDAAMKTNKKNTALMAAVARAYWNVDPVAYDKEIQKLIQKAFKESKNTESAVYMLQGDMVAKQDPGEAAGLYEMAITQDAQKGVVNREGYVKYANVYIKHNPELVIEKLEELNELEPNSGLAQRELAEKYYENRQYGKAWKSYERYVQNPNHFRLDEKRFAGLLFSAEQYPQSIEWAEKVLKEDPSEYSMYRILALNYDRLKQPEKVVENGQKLFSYPNATLVANDYEVYGNALSKSGKFEDAVGVYEKAIAAFPDNHALLPKLSAVYQEAGDQEKAVETQKRYLETGAASAADYYDMAARYASLARSFDKGNPDRVKYAKEGLTYNAKAIELKNNDPRYYYQTCVLDLTANDDRPDAATVDAYKKLLELVEPNETYRTHYKSYLVSAYYMLGNYYMDRDKSLSKDYYNKYLELRPDDANVKAIVDKL